MAEKACEKRRTMNLVLLGCGGVGKALVQMIIGRNEREMHKDGAVHLAVVAVCDSSGAAVKSKGRRELDDKALTKIVEAKDAGLAIAKLARDGLELDVREFSAKTRIQKLINLVDELGSYSGLVVVDLSASAETGDILKHVVDTGHCVVLANKKPLSSSLELHEALTSAGRRFRCESTVGAALPVMSCLARLMEVDNVHKVLSCPSGTLNYIMMRLQDGHLFSEVVKSAKEMGYTEPDPRDDLSGMDVARKTLIMGRQTNRKISLEDVKVESLYQPEMGPQHMSLKEFMENGLRTLDPVVQIRVQTAAANKCVLRYISTVADDIFTCCMVQVPLDSPLGRLRGSDNMFQIFTDVYKEPNPLVIQGAGAGNTTTAAGVLVDILDLQDLFRDFQ